MTPKITNQPEAQAPPHAGELFRGPWAGLPVSWTEDDRFDEATYRAAVADCCRAGVPGVYTGGTTGEFYAMEFDEFQRVARATVEECRLHNTPVMIGCTSTYSLGAMRRAAFAAEIGAQAVQVALPFWMEVADDQIVRFFSDVAKVAPGLAFSIYETTRSKKILSLDQHRRIKQAIPAYQMVKANAGTLGATPDGCAALSKFVSVFVGEHLWPDLGPIGAGGCCSAAVYWNPQIILGMWRHVERHEWNSVAATADQLRSLYAFFNEAFIPRGLTDTALDRLGAMAGGFVRPGLRSRLPYPSATSEDVRRLQQWYREHWPEMLRA